MSPEKDGSFNITRLFGAMPASMRSLSLLLGTCSFGGSRSEKAALWLRSNCRTNSYMLLARRIEGHYNESATQDLPGSNELNCAWMSIPFGNVKRTIVCA